MMKITISRTAASVIGLDDPCLMSDIKRTNSKRMVACEGTPEALNYLALVLFDYSGVDGDDIGEGFSRADRRACLRDSKKIKAALDTNQN